MQLHQFVHRKQVVMLSFWRKMLEACGKGHPVSFAYLVHACTAHVLTVANELGHAHNLNLAVLFRARAPVAAYCVLKLVLDADTPC